MTKFVLVGVAALAWAGNAFAALSDDLGSYRSTADVRRLDAAQAEADAMMAKGVPTDGKTVRCFIELATYFPPDVARKYRSAVKAAYAALPDGDPEKTKATAILTAFANRRKTDAPIAAMLPAKPRGWKMKAHVSAWAEEILKNPLCKTLDDLYAESQKAGKPMQIKSEHHNVINRITCLAEAELAERKGRFIPKLEEYIRLYSRQRAWCVYAYRNSDHYGNPPGKVQFPDLEATHFAALLGNVLWNLRDCLSPETVSLAKAAIERHIFQPARREIPMYPNQGMGGKGGPPWRYSFLYWIDGHSNWNAVCWNGLVHAALVTLDDPEDRAYFVKAAINSIPAYLAGLTDEGYCQEGPSYWNYGFGHHLRMGLFLREQTDGKLDIFTWPRQRACATYGWKFVLSGDLMPPYADAEAISRPAKDILKGCERIWPDIACKPGNFTEYPAAQVWLFRSEKGYSISFKGGHNAEIHNNNDVGTYSLMRNGKLVAGEPGGEVYTARTWSDHRYDSYVLSSYGHAVPIVAGERQKEGRQYAAKLLERDVDGPVKSIALELKGAYPVKTLKTLRRTCRYDTATGEATITDHVEFTEPAAFEDAYNLFRQEDNSTFKTSNWAFVEWNVRPEVVVTKGGDYDVTEMTLTNPGALTPRRVAITFKNKVTEAEVVFRYACPTGPKAEAPTTDGQSLYGVSTGPSTRTCEEVNAAARAVLQKAVDEKAVAGAISLVAVSGRVEAAYVGLADPRTGRPMDKDCFFWIASMSKGFCGAAVMACVDRGLLSLDDPVEKYIPSMRNVRIGKKETDGRVTLVPTSKKMTLRMCLSHVAGYDFNTPETKAHQGDGLSLAEKAEAAAKFPLLRDVETKHQYANPDIDLAARCVEVVTGKSYEDFLQETFFTPLKMTNTTFFPTKEQFEHRVFVSRIKVGAPYEDGNNDGWTAMLRDQKLNREGRYASASGGLYATAGDIMKFYLMLANDGKAPDGTRILSHAAILQLSTAQYPKLDRYSLGLRQYGDWFGHDGALQTEAYANWKENRAVLLFIQVVGAWRHPFKMNWRQAVMSEKKFK